MNEPQEALPVEPDVEKLQSDIANLPAHTRAGWERWVQPDDKTYLYANAVYGIIREFVEKVSAIRAIPEPRGETGPEITATIIDTRPPSGAGEAATAAVSGVEDNRATRSGRRYPMTGETSAPHSDLRSIIEAHLSLPEHVVIPADCATQIVAELGAIPIPSERPHE